MPEKGDDEVINVQMPLGDYKVMRDMIEDRKSTSFVLRKVKVYSIAISGVIAAWFLIGDKVILALRGL